MSGQDQQGAEMPPIPDIANMDPQEQQPELKATIQAGLSLAYNNEASYACQPRYRA